MQKYKSSKAPLFIENTCHSPKHCFGNHNIESGIKITLINILATSLILSVSTTSALAQETDTTKPSITSKIKQMFNKNEKTSQQNAKKKNLVLRLAIPNITILDKELEKNSSIINLPEKIKSGIVGNPGYNLIEIKEKYKNTELIDPDKIMALGRNNTVDIVLTGSITKLGDDVLLNIRIAETVIGKILYDKQYFAKPDQIDKISENIINDLNYFSANLDKFDINIIDTSSGNAEIKVRTIPSESQVAFDGVESGKTPLTLKNVAPTQHLIEAWQEDEGTIRNLNLNSDDNQIFQFKYDDKNYSEDVIELSDLPKSDEYNFEIIAKPEDNDTGSNRPKVSDVQYDLRKFKIQIITEPTNMQVLLDGNSAGTTPLVINDVRQGKHKISLARKKLFVFKKIVDASLKDISDVDLNLYKLGRVIVSSVPSKADILLNNEKLGVTPKSVDLPLGKHTLEVRRDGYKGEMYSVDIADGKTTELNANLSTLRNVDTNIAYLPTAAVDDTLGVSALFMSLGQYSVNNSSKTIAFLYGAEADYGFKNVFKIGEYFNFGAQIGAFYNKLGTFGASRDFPSNQGVGGKIQFLAQGEVIPVSVALGAFYNFNSSVQHQLNGYLTASRDFGFLSVHLGVQAQPFKLSALNLNVTYNRFYRLKLGASVLIDFGLLADRPGEYITPMFGLNAGYNFF